MNSHPLLKQYGDLVVADFVQHPVWVQCHVVDYDEPWYGQTNDETFRPWTKSLPADPSEGTLLVRACLTLRDGTQLEGFLTPIHEADIPGAAIKPRDLSYLQPVAFMPNGRQVSFWEGMAELTSEHKNSFYGGLRKRPEDVFPIDFAANPGLAGGRTNGQIPGFLQLREVRGFLGFGRKEKVVIST